MSVNNSRKKAFIIILCIALLTASVLSFFLIKNDWAAMPFSISENEYCIVLLSDTQFYSRNLPESFSKMTQFIEDNNSALNIQYVVHTGDIVNNPYEQQQWQNADAAMSELATVPYGVLPGNHDTGNGEDKYIDYRTYFSETRFADKEWYGEAHEGNRAHYDLITLGTQDCIVVYLSDEPSKCCIDFAKDAFTKYPERIGILCTHNYLEDDCTLTDMGEYMQQNIVAANENVRMVLCGHNSVTGYYTSTLQNTDGSERIVQNIISNYQDSRNDGGGGYMLFLKINENTKSIDAVTYSPLKNDFEGHTDPEINDEFSIDLPW